MVDVAAGAAAASAVLAVTVGREQSPPTAGPLEDVAVTSRVEGIDATTALVAHTWGVEVKLTAAGFDRGDRYASS